MRFAVVIHHAEEGGFWAEVPVIPGCFAQGETLEDLLGDMREAVESHISALWEDGQVIPVDDVLPEMAVAEIPA